MDENTLEVTDACAKCKYYMHGTCYNSKSVAWLERVNNNDTCEDFTEKE